MSRKKVKKITETRKLVKWGSSETLIMSLPRAWVKKFNLDKDSEVSVVESPDGSLLVSPLNFFKEKPGLESTIIFTDEMIDDDDILELEIMTRYLDGNDIITIELKPSKRTDKFPPRFSSNITKIIQSLLGLEITQFLSYKIQIKDIMSIHESNIDELVKIIANTTIDLFESLIDLIKNDDLGSVDSLLISRNQERKYYLRILRELRKGLLFPATLSRMGLTAQDTVDLAFFITYINETSEELEFMLKTMRGKKVENVIVEMIVDFMQKVKDTFKTAVDSYLFKKKKDAIAMIKRVPELETKKREIENSLDEIEEGGQYVHFQIALDLNSKILDECKNISLTALRRIL
ncbi:MAG: AbrB/MazE/SpoVT family DNA-binding domain-containing protein [Promethearchaeota archaeon]